MLGLINQPITTVTSKQINKLIGQLISIFEGKNDTNTAGGNINSGATGMVGRTVYSESMKQLISEIKNLLSQPHSTKTSKRMKELITQLITEITRKSNANTANANATGGNTTGSKTKTTKAVTSLLKHNKFYEALMERQAARRARRKELASLKSQKKEADKLKKGKGKMPNSSIIRY